MTSTLLIAPLAGSLVNFVNASFIVAGLLFIFALAGLSKFETSKKGNAYGILGMVIAIVATIVALVKLPGYSPVSIVLLFIPMLIGGALTVLIASINIFGGFTVTQRMLKMFRKA